MGGEGQMRLTDSGEIIDPAEQTDIIGLDTPENADFPHSEEAVDL